MIKIPSFDMIIDLVLHIARANKLMLLLFCVYFSASHCSHNIAAVRRIQTNLIKFVLILLEGSPPFAQRSNQHNDLCHSRTVYNKTIRQIAKCLAEANSIRDVPSETTVSVRTPRIWMKKKNIYGHYTGISWNSGKDFLNVKQKVRTLEWHFHKLTK